MAVLDVDEVEPGLPGEHGGRDDVAGELVELVVGEHRGAVGDAQPRVEHRVAVRRPRGGVAVGAGASGPSG